MENYDGITSRGNVMDNMLDVQSQGL